MKLGKERILPSRILLNFDVRYDLPLSTACLSAAAKMARSQRGEKNTSALRPRAQA